MAKLQRDQSKRIDWWPATPEETINMLSKMRDMLVNNSISKAQTIIGLVSIMIFSALSTFVYFQYGDIADFLVILSPLIIVYLIFSKRILEYIFKVPMTDNHTNLFQNQIEEYKSQGIWLT